MLDRSGSGAHMEMEPNRCTIEPTLESYRWICRGLMAQTITERQRARRVLGREGSAVQWGLRLVEAGARQWRQLGGSSRAVPVTLEAVDRRCHIRMWRHPSNPGEAIHTYCRQVLRKLCLDPARTRCVNLGYVDIAPISIDHRHEY